LSVYLVVDPAHSKKKGSDYTVICAIGVGHDGVYRLLDMIRDPKTVSGYAWTSVKGPPGPLRSQVSVTATITVADERPINLVLGQ